MLVDKNLYRTLRNEFDEFLSFLSDLDRGILMLTLADYHRLSPWALEGLRMFKAMKAEWQAKARR